MASILVHHGRHSQSHRASIWLSQHCFANIALPRPVDSLLDQPGPAGRPQTCQHRVSPPTRPPFRPGSRPALTEHTPVLRQSAQAVLSLSPSLTEKESERGHPSTRSLTHSCLVTHHQYRQRPTMTTISHTIDWPHRHDAASPGHQPSPTSLHVPGSWSTHGTCTRNYTTLQLHKHVRLTLPALAPLRPLLARPPHPVARPSSETLRTQPQPLALRLQSRRASAANETGTVSC